MDTQKDSNSYLETLSVISHELKTPVNLIAATARIADMRVKNNSLEAETLEGYFSNIINNCNRIELMLNNIMSSTTLSLQQFELLDANEFVKKFSDMLKCYSEKLNFTFKATAKSDKPLNIPVAPIERIILNLVTNAVKYNSKEEKKVALKISSGDGFTYFSVKDNGDGIAPRNIEKVTKKFFRVGGVNVPGMGLGLHLVKNLISQLNGTLEIKSKEKKGTEVIFSVPDSYPSKLALYSNDYVYNPSKSTFDIEFSTLFTN